MFVLLWVTAASKNATNNVESEQWTLLSSFFFCKWKNENIKCQSREVNRWHFLYTTTKLYTMWLMSRPLMCVCLCLFPFCMFYLFKVSIKLNGVEMQWFSVTRRDEMNDSHLHNESMQSKVKQRRRKRQRRRR